MLGDERYASVKDISDLDVKLLKKIVQFFEPYFELSGWLNHAETIEVIKEAHEAYIANPKPRNTETRIDDDSEDDETAAGCNDAPEETIAVAEDAERADHDDQGEEEDADPDN